MFLVKRGAISDRIDAIYCSPSNRLEIVEKTSYPVNKLSELAYLQRGRFSHRPRNDPKFYDGQYPFIQTGDIVKASQEGGEIIFTQSLNKLGLSVSKLFQPDVLVMTIAANIGDTAILTYPACFPDSLVTIIPKGNRVSVEYLNVYSKFLKKYLDNLAPQAAQKNINLQQLSPTPVVVPPIEIQAQIVEKFNQAYELKRQKEAEAKALLESIDGYLLEKLGIELPTANEPKKFFYTRFKDVQGKRFDANAFKEDRINSIQSLNNCIFPIEKLKFVTKFIKNIVTKNHQQLPYLGLENIESNTGFYIETTEKESFSSAFHFSKNHVIFPKLRPYLNKVTKTNFEGLCSTELHVLQPHKVTSDFLAIFLRSSLVINQTKCLMSGNTLPRLQTEDIESLLIPIPDLNTQFEIASYVTETFYKANQLKSEAKEAIETAKAEVERMILGES